MKLSTFKVSEGSFICNNYSWGKGVFFSRICEMVNATKTKKYIRRPVQCTVYTCHLLNCHAATEKTKMSFKNIKKINTKLSELDHFQSGGGTSDLKTCLIQQFNKQLLKKIIIYVKLLRIL